MIEMNQIAAYMVPSIVILCYLVGYIVKNLIPSDKVNRFIPLLVGVIGVVAAILIAIGAGTPITIDIIIGGLVSGLASTGAENLFSKLLKHDTDDVVTIPKGEDTSQISSAAIDAAQVSDNYQPSHMKTE